LLQKAIIDGDAISASIIAKTYRDDLMKEIDKIYPEYGFSKHVGNGTKAHFEAIKKYGACPLHRKTFRGVL
jgi:ribonuclease HII